MNLKRDLPFVAAALLIVGLLTYLSLSSKERFIPRIPAHVAAVYIKDRAEADVYCFSCHNPDAPRGDAPPMPPPVLAGDNAPAPGRQDAGERRHPIRTKNCRQCHRLERKK